MLYLPAQMHIERKPQNAAGGGGGKGGEHVFILALRSQTWVYRWGLCFCGQRGLCHHFDFTPKPSHAHPWTCLTVPYRVYAKSPSDRICARAICPLTHLLRDLTLSALSQQFFRTSSPYPQAQGPTCEGGLHEPKHFFLPSHQYNQSDTVEW